MNAVMSSLRLERSSAMARPSRAAAGKLAAAKIIILPSRHTHTTACPKKRSPGRAGELPTRSSGTTRRQQGALGAKDGNQRVRECVRPRLTGLRYEKNAKTRRKPSRHPAKASVK